MKNYFFDTDSIKKILKLAWPLILATSSSVIQQFVDKIYLAHFSEEALAAVVPAGMVACIFTCLFTGTVSYVSNFIAQYKGAGDYNKIPVIMHQAFIISALCSLVCIGLCFIGDFIFSDIAKHSEELVRSETAYYCPLLYLSFVSIFNSAIGCFFIGIEKTDIILKATVIATAINIIFDFIFIFGKFGFPEMGLKGAAFATALGQFIGLIYNLCIYFSSENNIKYNTRTKFVFAFSEIKKLFRYGFPNGVEMTMDFIIWTSFMMLIGHFSIIELASSNIAFQIDQAGFMPIWGIGMAVSIIVANSLGKGENSSLGIVIKSAIFISLVYIVFMDILFVFFPKILIIPFTDKGSLNNDLIRITSDLLKIMSVYLIFDGLSIIFIMVLRGAGATLFIMWTMLINGFLFIVIPAFYAVKINNMYFAWWSVVLYAFMISLIFFLKVKKGNWKNVKITA